jgi:hypothetical protein
LPRRAFAASSTTSTRTLPGPSPSRTARAASRRLRGAERIDGDFSENPIDYDFVSGEILTDPAVTGDAQITYKRALPALSNTITTNWLLTRAPDAYLFGALVHAEFYGWNDERLPLIKSALDEMIEEMRLDSEAAAGDRPRLPRW